MFVNCWIIETWCVSLEATDNNYLLTYWLSIGKLDLRSILQVLFKVVKVWQVTTAWYPVNSWYLWIDTLALTIHSLMVCFCNSLFWIYGTRFSVWSSSGINLGSEINNLCWTITNTLCHVTKSIVFTIKNVLHWTRYKTVLTFIIAIFYHSFCQLNCLNIKCLNANNVCSFSSKLSIFSSDWRFFSQ